ncbi:MAG TPA: hypothetical protein VH234_05925 [Candidatus Saccharimonadales bacterium]|jgi:hypothetical protein|nr:hypothetical protein [Candidatus Saccharimonadales bacterium]
MPEGDNQDDAQIEVARPGAVISPGAPPKTKQEAEVAIPHDSPPIEPVASPQQPLPEPVATAPTEQTPALAEPSPPAIQALQPEPEGFFTPEADDQPAVAADVPSSVSWTASEFIAHNKSAGWYLGLTVATAILAFFIYLLTKDFISVGVVIVAAAVFGIYGSHKPRQLEYQLDLHGLSIGGKRYDYDQFKSFSVVPEGGLSSIVFMPLKRFAPPLSVYYPPEEEDKITAVLAEALPFEEPRRDAVDSLMKKVRF